MPPSRPLLTLATISHGRFKYSSSYFGGLISPLGPHYNWGASQIATMRVDQQCGWFTMGIQFALDNASIFDHTFLDCSSRTAADNNLLIVMIVA